MNEAYYTYWEPAEDGVTPVEIKLSESQIINYYWDYWRGRMIEKYGQECFEEHYSTKDCIEDWCIVHWASKV